MKAQPPTKDRSHWTIQRCASFEEMRARHIANWQQVSARERTNAAWELVEYAWKVKKRDPNELRVRRAITSFRRA